MNNPTGLGLGLGLELGLGLGLRLGLGLGKLIGLWLGLLMEGLQSVYKLEVRIVTTAYAYTYRN